MENHYSLPLLILLVQLSGILCLFCLRVLLRPKKQQPTAIDTGVDIDNKPASGWHQGVNDPHQSLDLYPRTSSTGKNNNMDTIREPYILDLAHRGYIQGVTILKRKKDTLEKSPAEATIPLCRYFGGLRYALPPTRRWGQARPLPRGYSYGSRSNPGRHDGQAAVCPQPGASWDDPGLDEDCFQCNVWVPVGRCPDGGEY